jgi:hypothetical protein
MDRLAKIYELLLKEDQDIAHMYKEGVFDHILRILLRSKINVSEKDTDEIAGPTSDPRDIELVKKAIQNLVDYLA